MKRLTSQLSRSLLILCCATGLACGGGDATPHEPDSETRLFVDVTVPAGLSGPRLPDRPMNHILESTGSGVAVGDYDGDGDDDLFFVQQPTIAQWLAGEPGPPHRLYRNEGDGRFTEVGAEAGVAHQSWGNAAYFVDYDNDSDLDLFILNWGYNQQFENRGDGSFVDISERSGLRGGATDWSSSASFGDLDADGFTDLFVVNYCEYDPANPPTGGIQPNWRGIDVFLGPKGLQGQHDRLYRNIDGVHFEERSQPAGIHDRPALYGLASTMQDLDQDGDLDIYVANDSVVNQLWRNDGRFRFSDVATLSGTATNESAMEQAGMGVTCADVDRNGMLDLFVTNFAQDWNTLYLNDGGLRYRDATFEAGLAGSFNAMGWGTRLFDFDLDGILDLAVANGHIYPQVNESDRFVAKMRQQNVLLRQGDNGRFNTVDDASWSVSENSRALATFDYDLDGDLDLIFTQIDAAPTLLRNDASDGRHWIAFRLVGTSSARDAIGARVSIESDGDIETDRVRPFGSYLSQSSAAVYFGLGDKERVSAVTVEWPSGAKTVYGELQADRYYRLVEGASSAEPLNGRAP